ncbi:MAG: LysM peptidoglycan-binding domain-containing protein [Solibacillus sp.]
MNKKFLAFATVVILGAGIYATDASAAPYTVKTGDTLWSISQEYSMSVEELQQINNIDSTVIYPNQKLAVAKEATKYTVQPNDTLFNIAVAHNVTVEQLIAWNGLTSDLIYVDDTLAVSPSAAVKANTAVSEQVAGTYTMEATAYTAYCTGCSGITANGTDIRENPNLKVIAVDPNVIRLGTKVWVEGYGEAVAADTGGAIKGNRIDVFIPNEADAYEWGRKNVEVKILK